MSLFVRRRVLVRSVVAGLLAYTSVAVYVGVGEGRERFRRDMDALRTEERRASSGEPDVSDVARKLIGACLEGYVTGMLWPLWTVARYHHSKLIRERAEAKAAKGV